uniref:Uncharacterized protein n=1 Tax=Arundo donax TaxID=35708 RepID=A0A0A8ZHP0_ARUDO
MCAPGVTSHHRPSIAPMSPGLQLPPTRAESAPPAVGP